MREHLFLDTSALMRGGESLLPGYDQIRPGCVVVLSGMVLRELDRHKNGCQAEDSHFTREAARQIEELQAESECTGASTWKLSGCSPLELDLSSWRREVGDDADTAIIKLASEFAERHKSDDRAMLVSRARILWIRAMAAGLATLDPDEPKEVSVPFEPTMVVAV
jgi:predicted ribonuclease YlaK